MEFAREKAYRLTPEQVREFWIAKQRKLRAAGLSSYERLLVPETGKIVADSYNGRIWTLDGLEVIPD
jgi:hypothetical protein